MSDPRWLTDQGPGQLTGRLQELLQVPDRIVSAQAEEILGNVRRADG